MQDLSKTKFARILTLEQIDKIECRMVTQQIFFTKENYSEDSGENVFFGLSIHSLDWKRLTFSDVEQAQ